jgi:acetolactate synthase-1/2/3 large subunit
MKLSDYIVQFLVDQGITHSFVISGGAIIHTIDSAAQHPGMEVVCVQHEQSAGAAADGYSRVTRNIGAAMVTSGPGATNLTTSICNAYFDSIPTLFICGQVTTARLRPSPKLRQKGFQETDIVSLFQSITKYVTRVMDPYEIRYELEKAVYYAKEGRPGPVVIDIPDDLQRTDIDVAQLRAFTPPPLAEQPDNNAQVSVLLEWIKTADRPLLVLGAGVRIADAVEETLTFARRYGIPVVLTWGGRDLLTWDDPLNMGGIGVVGPRAGNFAAQTADLVIGVGTRLSQLITGGKQSLFAPNARKVMIDIDPHELSKFTANDFALDLGIQSGLKDFYRDVASLDTDDSEDRFHEWRARIRLWHAQYPVCPPDMYDRADYVDGRAFVEQLSHQVKPGTIIIGDTGANLAWTAQAFRIKEGQRLFSAWNHTPMGFALPAAVGAASAVKGDIICLTGDGGLMMCIQELATVARYNLPVKIFVFNNQGHGIQRQTIDTWLNSRYTAVDYSSGLNFPEYDKVSEAFGLPSVTIHDHTELQEGIRRVLETPGPIVADIRIIPDQKIVPMLKFGSGLEDLDPKLPEDIVRDIMSLKDKDKLEIRN